MEQTRAIYDEMRRIDREIVSPASLPETGMTSGSRRKIWQTVWFLPLCMVL